MQRSSSPKAHLVDCSMGSLEVKCESGDEKHKQVDELRTAHDSRYARRSCECPPGRRQFMASMRPERPLPVTGRRCAATQSRSQISQIAVRAHDAYSPCVGPIRAGLLDGTASCTGRIRSGSSQQLMVYRMTTVSAISCGQKYAWCDVNVDRTKDQYVYGTLCC